MRPGETGTYARACTNSFLQPGGEDATNQVERDREQERGWRRGGCQHLGKGLESFFRPCAPAGRDDDDHLVGALARVHSGPEYLGRVKEAHRRGAQDRHLGGGAMVAGDTRVLDCVSANRLCAYWIVLA